MLFRKPWTANQIYPLTNFNSLRELYQRNYTVLWPFLIINIHTHTRIRFCWCHCLVCVGPQTLQQCWVSGLYLSQPSLCCSGYNSKVTQAHTHIYTYTGKWKKIIFHVCEMCNGCLGGVCSHRKWFQYDMTLNCPSNTHLININKLLLLLLRVNCYRGSKFENGNKSV